MILVEVSRPCFTPPSKSCFIRLALDHQLSVGGRALAEARQKLVEDQPARGTAPLKVEEDVIRRIASMQGKKATYHFIIRGKS